MLSSTHSKCGVEEVSAQDLGELSESRNCLSFSRPRLLCFQCRLDAEIHTTWNSEQHRNHSTQTNDCQIRNMSSALGQDKLHSIFPYYLHGVCDMVSLKLGVENTKTSRVATSVMKAQLSNEKPRVLRLLSWLCLGEEPFVEYPLFVTTYDDFAG